MHNLKNIDVDIPRDKLVVITGLSGSGKSSLAFDTIYAEGQRRFMETLSAYARQFIGDMENPDVDKIDGLSPAIAIEQKTISQNPRSTVGTVTEIYDYLRLLFARCGIQHSPDTGNPVTRQTVDQIFENVMKAERNSNIVILAPLVTGRKGIYKELFEDAKANGFTKVRVDNEIFDLSGDIKLSRFKIHDIEVVVDRVTINQSSKSRIFKSLETALKTGNGIVIINSKAGDILYSEKLSDPVTGRSFSELNPNSFSFNSQYGWCPKCKGLGVENVLDLERLFCDKSLSLKTGGISLIDSGSETWLFTKVEAVLRKYGLSANSPVSEYPENVISILVNGSETEKFKVIYSTGHFSNTYSIKFEGLISYAREVMNGLYSARKQELVSSVMNTSVCEKCGGGRLKEDALWVRIAGKGIHDLTRMQIDELPAYLENLEFDKRNAVIAAPILKEIKTRLNFLLNVGLEYLTLDRSANTLSGGEAQRIRLATQIGSRLSGVLYILDEPSIGLHQRDNIKLINSLKDLRDLGNSVIVVEHDREMMENADYIIDLGPGAGEHGGEVVAFGIAKKFKGKSVTTEYLTNEKAIPYSGKRRKGSGDNIILSGAVGNNLKNVSLNIPVGKFICVTGVSGSGKSSLINDTLYKILKKHFHNSIESPLPYKEISGLSVKTEGRKFRIIDKVIEIDQQPIGRTPRSNPATYTGLFTHIREIYASLPESKIRGYKIGRFSFNVKSGRCETCGGGGLKKIEMNFLPDVYVTCDVCKGKRYNSETLQIKYKGKSIADVLDMTVEDAVGFFEPFPSLHRKLKTLHDVGLDYIKIGQQATTLSGGEAQRVKLATELSKVQTGRTIYLLDEPTTGLHFEDIKMLLEVLNKLVDKGNTVIIIEHNMDIIKNADWVIDMGPEGGEAGGRIIAEGTPEQLVSKFQKVSYTAKYLKEYLNK